MQKIKVERLNQQFFNPRLEFNAFDAQPLRETQSSFQQDSENPYFSRQDYGATSSTQNFYSSRVPATSLKKLTAAADLGSSTGNLAPAKNHFRRNQRFSTRPKNASSAAVFQPNPYQRNASLNNSTSPG